MTIKYYDEVFKDEEENKRRPFIGYFSPSGDIINYNILLDGMGGHDHYRNPVSYAFISYVSMVLKGTSVEDSLEGLIDNNSKENFKKRNAYPGRDEIVLRGYTNYKWGSNSFTFIDFLERLNREYEYKKQYAQNPYSIFELEMLQFLKNAYASGTFFETIGKLIEVETYSDYEARNEKKLPKKDYNRTHDEREIIIYDELKKILLSYIKDICVQYLGYDAIERFRSFRGQIEHYGMDEHNLQRMITSSHIDINERYYNYLLMDWTVERLPRYYYNSHTKRYEPSQLQLYTSEKEQHLEMEIQAIKKLVPLEERKRYFR